VSAAGRRERELAAAVAGAAAQLLEREAIEAERQAELIRAYLAGYGRAVEEVRALTLGCPSPPQAIPSEVGRTFRHRLLQAFGLEWA
jgi:hypothetical protein